jgi:hypothetical protein
MKQIRTTAEVATSLLAFTTFVESSTYFRNHLSMSSRAYGAGGKAASRVAFCKQVTEVLSELQKMRYDDKPDGESAHPKFGESISDKFPQVYVFGDQSCGKSLLLNAMVNLELFPSDVKQCTVRPTYFIREYCDVPRAVATVDWKKMEATSDGSLQLKPETKEFNLDEAGLPQLLATILRLQKMKDVIDLLRVPPNLDSSASSGDDRFDLMKWGDTAIHILVKVPVDRRDGNPVEFLQFVDLPGLQVAEPKGVPASNADYQELAVPREKVNDILIKESAHPDWFTAPWFSFLTVQFLKKPSSLGIHCISSQATLGNIRSERLIAELKERTKKQANTVKVWTKVDFHCPKPSQGREPSPWVSNFQARRHDLFQTILTSDYFVGALHPQGDTSHEWPLMYKCLRGGLGHTNKEELLREGSQVATLLVEHEERHAILQRLGPFACLEKCVHFIDEGFNSSSQFLKANCEEEKKMLKKYIVRMGEVYPMSRHGAGNPSHIDQWTKRVLNSVLVFFIAGTNHKLAFIKNPRPTWMEKVNEFQTANMKHCLRTSADEHRPAFMASISNFCPDIDFLAGTFLDWTFSSSEGLLKSNPKFFPKTKECQTPLDSMMEELSGNENAFDKFQTLLPVEGRAHNTVKKMLLRLGKSGDGIFSPCKLPQDYICDDWWYTFRDRMESLIEKICQSVIKCACDYMIAGHGGDETPDEETPMPLYAKESYTALFEIFEKNLIEIVRMNWKQSIETERANIVKVCQVENASQLTLKPEVLRKICCVSPDTDFDQKGAAPRFELIIDSIERILSSWDAEQSSSECRGAPSSKDDATPSISLPDFSLECKSYIKKDRDPSDILKTFGAKVVKPNSNPLSFGYGEDIGESIQALLRTAAVSNGKGSSWTPVPRFDTLCEDLLVHKVHAGSAVPGQKLPSIRIEVLNVNFHYIKPSQHYDESSLFWCLKVIYDDWIPARPPQMIFRSLPDFSQLWQKMKEHGNIDCNPDHLPVNKSFFGEHRYHHADFIRSKTDNLQKTLTDISEAVMRMSSEVCKQELLKWLEFNKTEQLYSDLQIMKFKQSQFSGAVESFWQEAKSCTLAKAKAALEAIPKKDKAYGLLNPYVDAIAQVEALKTTMGSRISAGQFVSDDEIFQYYSVMKTLKDWRADKPTAFREFIGKLSSKFSRVRSAGNPSARNFKLEAQFIASIELAQTFMQSTCFNLYSLSFSSLESTLGEAGLVDTVTKKVNEAVKSYIIRLRQKIDAKSSQYDEVLRLHPMFTCPASIEENMRIANETISRLFKIQQL